MLFMFLSRIPSRNKITGFVLLHEHSHFMISQYQFQELTSFIYEQTNENRLFTASSFFQIDERAKITASELEPEREEEGKEKNLRSLRSQFFSKYFLSLRKQRGFAHSATLKTDKHSQITAFQCQKHQEIKAHRVCCCCCCCCCNICVRLNERNNNVFNW